MVKELYQIHSQQVSLNVTDGAVDSIRKKNIVKSGCRVYENGCIGVAGTLGQPTVETWKAAEEALSLGIACQKGPTTNLVRSRSKGTMPEEKEFLAWAENILAQLKEEFPRYILSNKITAQRTEITLKNDAGLDLREEISRVNFVVVVKDETSANAMDTFITFEGDFLDTDTVLDTARQVLTAHSNVIPMPEEELPTLLQYYQLYGPLAMAVNGTRLHKGASLLSGKVGQKLFADNFNLVINRDSESGHTFFDEEGTTLAGDSMALIENGVFLRGTADKKCADEFGGDLTASGSGDYDDVPQLSSEAMDVVPTGTMEEILDGQDAICISTASGGDTTPAGDFGTPVQTAYLVRNGRLTGRLPEFNFGGSIFDLLGSGYLGCPREKFLGDRWLVVKGKIR